MSRKKTTKRLLADYEDWLSELTKDQLARVRVTMGISKPKFTAVVEKAQETLGESAA